MTFDELLITTLKKKGLLTDEISQGLIKESQISGKAIEDLIYDKKLIDEKEIANAKSEIFKLPVKIFTKDEKIDPNILKLMAEDSARNYNLVVFNKDKESISVGLIHPEDPRIQEVLKFIFNRYNLKPKLFIITPSDLKRAWLGYENFQEKMVQILQEFQQKYPRKSKPVPSDYQLVDLEMTGGAMIEEAPVIKLLSTILTHAVRSNASDIHIEPQRRRLRVRLRIDGVLFTNIILPLELHLPLVSRIKILTNLKIDETRMPQDGRFRTIIDGREIDYRVSTFPTAFGEKVAIRILDSSIGLKTIEELGLMGRNMEVLTRGMEKPFGMILLSGPTGSGKSTTLYAIMQKMNRDNVNIISLEDPVEYTMEGINQSQVLPEIGYTFARGLRQILRQDPDVILIGEIRDNETAELATHAALTGHIVLSTIHTNNAIGVIPRLLDMQVPPFLLPSALNLMIAQRLVRRLCPNCKKAVPAPEKATQIIEEALNSLPPNIKATIKYQKPYTIYQPVGCSECQNKGLKGRIALFEILEMTPQIEKIILSQMSETELLKESERQGMITLRQDGIMKVLEGITTLEEVLRET